MSEVKPILKTENIQRTYAVGKTSLDVLKGVSMEVREGETISIMGESGSGKSTLLHVLGGLDKPMMGTVCFRGQDIYSMNGTRRALFRAENVGFVFQSFHLLPELNILENVALPAMSSRKRKSGALQRAEELLGEVGLSERIKHRPQELSGGERQRVALARSLMNDPDIIFADEPTGNLDSKTGEKVLASLFQMMKSRNRTLVMVTHNHDVAAMCSRQMVLKDGIFA